MKRLTKTVQVIKAQDVRKTGGNIKETAGPFLSDATDFGSKHKLEPSK